MKSFLDDIFCRALISLVMTPPSATPFCTAPWHSLSLSPNGPIGPCCMIPNGLGNLAKGDTLQGAWEGQALKNFRQSLLDGNLHKGCQECQAKENMGIKSVKRFYDEVAQSRPTSAPYTLDAPLDEFYRLDLSLSNKCNLKCRFCYSGNSTAWFKDRDAMVKEDSSYEHTLGVVREVVDISTDLIFPFVKDLKNLKEMELKGGEPFMSKGHLPLLQYLIDIGVAPNLTLLYTTNLTIFDDKVLDLWPHFRHIALSVSVDGTKDVYRYVRGGSYTLEHDVLPTLNRIHSLKLPNLSLNTHYTICAYNLLDIGHFLEWHQGLDWHRRPDSSIALSFGWVETPLFLTPRLLPSDLIEEACRRINRFDIPQAQDLVKGLKNIEDRDWGELKKRFFDFTYKLDKLRDLSLEQAVPELASFYKSLEPIHERT